MEILRKQDWESEDEGDEMITYFVKIIISACNEVISCSNCKQSYHIRHCKNPREGSDQVDHAIEISCKSSGDFLTLAEGRG
ncbi:hypothetical protein [Paenibacillus silviterrae]|uniref:hypothetical protein n=1 Tax=Paenibacillus silviterrae TaxID=3242194 RepID=UPI0025427C8D|nr:hypothetical protein [Paenibacillus chinjuensis]